MNSNVITYNGKEMFFQFILCVCVCLNVSKGERKKSSWFFCQVAKALYLSLSPLFIASFNFNELIENKMKYIRHINFIWSNITSLNFSRRDCQLFFYEIHQRYMVENVRSFSIPNIMENGIWYLEKINKYNRHSTLATSSRTWYVIV